MATAGGALDEALVEEFKAAFRGELLRPGDPGYEEARTVWNAMIDRRPALIARCHETDDVVTAVAQDGRAAPAEEAGGAGDEEPHPRR